MARLRQGRANTARGAANFLRETVSRVRYAGATGPLTVRADSGFYTHDTVETLYAIHMAKWELKMNQSQIAETAIRQYLESQGFTVAEPGTMSR